MAEVIKGGDQQEPLAISPRPVLIFGIGPVIDGESRVKAGAVGTIPGKEDVPLFCDNLAQAASILHQKGAASTFFAMGGRTGGPQYASESELIKAKMERLGVPGQTIDTEDQSYDTPTNLLHFLNMYTSKDAPVTEPGVSLLAASWQIHRVKFFAKMFGIPVANIFAAEEVLRFKARTDEGELTTDALKWDKDLFQKVENMLDVNNPQSSFYATKKGVERGNAHTRFLRDNLWIREALEYPQRLPQVIAQIQNDARVREMVKIQFVVHGKDAMEQLGIHLEDDIDTLRANLQRVQWPFLSAEDKQRVVERWTEENVQGQGWPKELLEKFHRLMSYTPGQNVA